MDLLSSSTGLDFDGLPGAAEAALGWCSLSNTDLGACLSSCISVNRWPTI